MALSALAQEAEFFSVRHDPAAYPHPTQALQNLVQTKGKQRNNHICVVGYQKSAGDKNKYAWVYWKEANALVLWNAWLPQGQAQSALIESRRFLDLAKDVVATEADAHSTYLVTTRWVAKTKADCAQHGDKFLIIKKARR